MDELIASKFPIYMEETSKKFKTDLYNFNFLDKQVLCWSHKLWVITLISDSLL